MLILQQIINLLINAYLFKTIKTINRYYINHHNHYCTYAEGFLECLFDFCDKADLSGDVVVYWVFDLS